MLEAGFVGSRFLHFTALLLVFGVALFPFYSWRQAEHPPQIAVRLSFVLVPVAMLVAIASGGTWFASVVNTMADSPSAFLERDAVQYTLSDTAFGQLWLIRAVLACTLLAYAIVRWFRARSPRDLGILVLSGAVLASLAGTGHTQSASGVARLLQEGSDGIHLLAAGAWLGGLIPLAVVSARAPERDAERVLARFSSVGYVAVAALLLTGVVNAYMLVGTLQGLIGMPYGRLLLVKILLFALMLTLAAINRVILVPALASKTCGSLALPRLRRHIILEQLLGVSVIAIVSLLGTLEPPDAMAM